MHNVFFSMPALSLKLPIPILWVFFVFQFRLIFPTTQERAAGCQPAALFLSKQPFTAIVEDIYYRSSFVFRARYNGRLVI